MTKLTVTADIKDEASLPEYPFLGVTERGLIVLFPKECKGTVLFVGNILGYSVAEYSENWNMNNFKQFIGSITLTQN